MMLVNSYQEHAEKTAIYPEKGELGGLLYVTLGLCGEAGEFADKVKKILRDSGGIITDEKRIQLKKELGDVLWYVSQAALELDLTLEDVALENLAKLGLRKEQGKIGGSGDNR